MLKSCEYYLRRERILALLDGLSSQGGSARTLHVPPGSSSEHIARLVEKMDAAGAPPELASLAAASRTGAAIFWGESRKYLVLPPFPVVEERLDEGFFVDPLVSLLNRELRIAIILVRLGAYAIGLCQGEHLVASHAGTGNVHARHRQGGSSAMRFQRHREKQIESFLTRVCGHIGDILRPEAETLDHVVYGGAVTTIVLLQKRCPFLEQFNDRSLAPLLDIPQPRRAVLEACVRRVWSSRVIEWSDDSAGLTDT